MVSDSPSVMHRPRRARPATARTAAAIVATAVLAVLGAACSGSPSSPGGSPNAGGPANSPSAVGYCHCMRSHCMPNFPDPDSSGVLPKVSAQELGVSTSQLQAGQRARQRLLPSTGGSFAATSPAVRAGRRLSTGCGAADADLRAEVRRVHAPPRGAELARPNIDTGGHRGVPFFDLGKEGIDDHSRQISPKMAECSRLARGLSVPEG
jgi:hypothetical protein